MEISTCPRKTAPLSLQTFLLIWFRFSKCGKAGWRGRRLCGAILWVLRTGVGWRDLPCAFGLWQLSPAPRGQVIKDKGYDSDTIRAYVNQLGGVAVIAIHPRRTILPPFDEYPITNVIASRISSPAPRPSAASPLAARNFTRSSLRCSPSLAFSFGSNCEVFYQTAPNLGRR